MNDAEKAIALDRLLGGLTEHENGVAKYVSQGRPASEGHRASAVKSLIFISQTARAQGLRLRSLELLAEALVDLHSAGKVGAILSRPRKKGGQRSSPFAAMFKGLVVACIELRMRMKPEISAAKARSWAVETINAAVGKSRVDGAGAVTLSAVRGWYERFRGRADQSPSRDAYLEHLAQLQGPSAPKTLAQLTDFLRRNTLALPEKPK
jgi:hypothetical protein